MLLEIYIPYWFYSMKLFIFFSSFWSKNSFSFFIRIGRRVLLLIVIFVYLVRFKTNHFGLYLVVFNNLSC